MKRQLCTIMWGVIAAFQLNAHQISSLDKTESIEQMPQLREMAFLVAPTDLVVSEDGISVNVNGHSFFADSLERRGNLWLVRTIADVDYCPQGHLTCRNCKQCHTDKCRYFVRRCKLWE